jgi:HNH endonuclease
MDFTDALAAVQVLRELDDTFIRFWQKVDVHGPDECWPWTGGKIGSSGYGQFSVGPRGNSVGSTAHRWAYEYAVGPIPAGLVLDHACHTDDPTCIEGDACPHRACCNPAHLEPVTQAENLRRKHNANAAKQVCKNGHPFDAENTYFRHGGERLCRACARNRDRIRRPSKQRSS